MPRQNVRTLRSYISYRQRQRRRSRDDSKFRMRFTENPACRPERIPKPWFWRAFGYFSRAGKVTRRRHGHPDSATIPTSAQQKTDTAEFPPCLNLSKSLTEFAALEPRKNPIRFFAAARTPQKTLCAQRSVAAPPIAGQGVDRSESRLVKKGIALFDQAQDSSIRSLSSSSPESLRNRSSRSSTVSFARSSPATSRTIFP